jgi:hypothetical protein
MDMENNLKNNNQHIVDLLSRLDKNHKRLMGDTKVIDHNYIKYLLKNCPHIKDFRINENGIIENEYLNDYINKKTNELGSLENVIANHTRMFQGIMQHFSNASISDIRMPYLNLILALVLGIRNYSISQHKNKNDKNNDIDFIVLNNLLLAGINQFQSIVFEYVASSYSSVISLVRMLYETIIIYYFISNHRNLASPFFIHGELFQYKYEESINQITPENLEKKNEILNTYGEDFELNYGWTKEEIPDKSKRNLKTLAEELQVEELKPFYFMASNIIHSNSFTINYLDMTKKENVNSYLLLSLEFITNAVLSFMTECKCEEREIIVMSNILKHIMQTVFFPDLKEGFDNGK